MHIKSVKQLYRARALRTDLVMVMAVVVMMVAVVVTVAAFPVVVS